MKVYMLRNEEGRYWTSLNEDMDDWAAKGEPGETMGIGNAEDWKEWYKERGTTTEVVEFNLTEVVE